MVAEVVIKVAVMVVILVVEALAKAVIKDMDPAITTTLDTRMTTRIMLRIFRNKILPIMDRMTVLILEESIINLIRVTIIMLLSNNWNRMRQYKNRPALDREIVIHRIDSIITIR